VSDAAREWLGITGYDPTYGARPLRRLVQKEIGDSLARLLLAGEVRDGDVVTVDVLTDGGVGELEGTSSGLSVRRAPSAAEADAAQEPESAGGPADRDALVG
jgi:ATP-dependent Clp protease ATP-binding subunit ClpB